MRRRSFLATLLGGAISSRAVSAFATPNRSTASSVAAISAPLAGEDLWRYLERTGGYSDSRYLQLLGAANEYKEGDQLAGVAAADNTSRRNARKLLENSRLGDVARQPLFRDRQSQLLGESLDSATATRLAPWTFGELRRFLLRSSEPAIAALLPGLSSEVIGCVVKLLSSDELRTVSSKLFHPLPGSQLGAKGYLGARLQPSSPTDNVDDLVWQVLDGFAYAVGDVVVGANPVSSDPRTVARLESALHELLLTFGLQDSLPHSVLAPLEVQAAVEAQQPGTTGIWFQSLGGSERANQALNVDLDKLFARAQQRRGRFGLYFETGQGGELFSGTSDGVDLVLHESRRYGLARALKLAVAQARGCRPSEVWLHVNSVAGFLGPQVVRSREQLVRCCLEDLVMGKLHGLMMGLDVGAALTMQLSLADLDWCLEQLVPAAPGYLVGLPTKRDPMLGYYSTAFADHLRLRQRYGLKVSDGMARFFRDLGVLDASGQPTAHFGDPSWVYLQYRRRKGDLRSDAEIQSEASAKLAAVQKRGVPLAIGHGKRHWEQPAELCAETHKAHELTQRSLWAELGGVLVGSLPATVRLQTRARDRSEFLLCPQSGEQLDQRSETTLRWLQGQQRGSYDVQLVISDGLNALALSDSELLLPFLKTLRSELVAAGYRVAPELVLLRGGRVRAGYRVGELLLGGLPGARAVVHLTGERPGSGPPSLSAYVTAPPATASGELWGQRGRVDERCTRVVSDIELTRQPPLRAAAATVRMLTQLSPIV